MILFTIECRVDSSVPHDLAALPIVSQPPRVSLHARVSIWKSLYIDFHKTEATRRVQWPTRRVRHLKPVHGKSARPESRNFWPTRRVIDPTRRVRFESAFSQNTKVVRNCVYFSEHFESRQSELRFMRYGQNTDEGSSCPATSFFLQNPRSKRPIARSASFSIRACNCCWKMKL